MIRHWLHAEPADDWEDWAGQVAQALFLEERHIRILAHIMGARTKA